MNKKRKAIILIGVFFLLMVVDCGLTWIATPDLFMEANPLVAHLNLGWTGLILGNLIVFALYAVLVWYSFVKYQGPVVKSGSFKEYLKELDEHKTSSVFLGAMGYAIGYSMIFGRIVPIVEWIVYIAGYRMPWFDKMKRAIPFQRPDLWLILILAIVFCALWYRKEYKENQKSNQLPQSV